MTKYGDAPELDTGRKAYREPTEPPDGRPVISYRPFWTDQSERLTYEHAVETHPRRPGEGPGTYIARLAGIVHGRLAPAAKSMPRGKEVAGEVQRLTRAEVEARVRELEGQR